jgi:uncharacterized protein YjdB
MLAKAGKVCLLSVAIVLSSLLMACGGDSHNSGSAAPSLSKLTIGPSSVALPNGTTQQLTATAVYSDGTSKNVTSAVAWSVTPVSAGKVSSAGLLTAMVQGAATVNATMSSVTGHLGITVQPPALTTIAITPASLSIPMGASQQLTATATYTDGTSGNVTSSVSWSATPTSVVVVGTAGLAQSVSKGSFSVTATSGSITGMLNASVGNAVAQSIQVLPTSAGIPKGATQNYSATAIFTDGSKQDVTASATWQSSNTAIAAVSSAGTATSSSQGSAEITASYLTFSATSALTVSTASIKTIQVSPGAASLAKGTNLQLSASAVLTDGSSQDVTNSVTWSSSASTVCSVSAGAMATAVNTGTCMATATSGSVSGSATLTVTAATLTGITITPPNPSVSSGGSVQLKATGNFSDGSTQDMTSSITFTSSKPLVALVLPTGLVQGLKPGTSTVTATSGSVSASISVTVTAATLQSLTVGTGTLSLAAGISAQLSAIGSYSDGSTQDLSTTVTWSSSATGIVAVNASGNVTGLISGSAAVTATLGSVSGTANVTVTPATIVSITVNPISVTIAAGQSQAFTATATLTDGSTTDVTASVHWSISDSTLATISNALGNPGVLAALIPGTGTVSASLGSVTGTGTLYVSAASLVGITVGPSGLSLALGVPAQLTATGTYSDGSTQDISASVSWSSSNGQLMTVAAGGLVTPLSIGNATVSASMNSQSGSVAVGVTAAILNSIHVSVSGSSLALGLSQQLTATGSYSDGSTQDITAVVHWSSSNTAIATISGGGLVLAVGGGSANITATLGSVTQTAPITVSAAILESINVTSTQNSFALGFTLQLKATGDYSDGSTQDLTGIVGWTSNNPAIALINGTGLISGLATGGITATATLQGVSGSLGVTVNAATLVSITVSPATVNLIQILLTQQFSVVGHFSDGSTQTLNTGIHWSCTNGLLATVNSTGLLTALGLGNLNVTATYGSLTATAAVSIL